MRDLLSGAVHGGAQPFDADFRLMRAGIEAGDQFQQLHAIVFQYAERALQTDGVEQGGREEADQR